MPIRKVATVIPIRGPPPPMKKRKVKTGCTTCKARKVKCDEAKPACNRCISTGRVCDGYGIWGGGGNGYHQRPRASPLSGSSSSNSPPSDSSTPPDALVRALKPVASLSPLSAVSTEELGYLEWFTARSATRLPGAFGSTFWGELVIQTCLQEPAILHAVLALSSAHKSHQMWGGINVPPQEERFFLQQYTKAIAQLQPHFSKKTKDSMRTALITCLIFVSLEFLRSHYRTGTAHLISGLKLLKEISTDGGTLDNGVTVLTPKSNAVDLCIFDTFSRMSVQAELFGQRPPDIQLVLHTADPESNDPTFSSLSAARASMDKLIHGITLLYARCREQFMAGTFEATPLKIEMRALGQAHLWSWLMTWKRTMAALADTITPREMYAYSLLRVYHIMAGIMADVCLSPDSDLRFDRHTYDFAQIVKRARALKDLHDRNGPDAHLLNPDPCSQSITDMGAIPLLSFAAMKCRAHHIRHAALKLLSSLNHKEGIFDSHLTTICAAEIVRIEERDFYDGVLEADEAVDGDLEELDRHLPILPEIYRLPDVQALLPDSDTERPKLVCQQREGDGSRTEFRMEYDATTETWIDIYSKRKLNCVGS